MRRRWLPLFLSGAAFGAVLVATVALLPQVNATPSVTAVPVLPFPILAPKSATTTPVAILTPSTELVEQSWNAKERWDVKRGSRVLLVPHHLIAAREIASLLDAAPAPSTVYLVSPDHFGQGRTTFTTTDASFVWNGRETAGDPRLVSRLLGDVPEMRTARDPFEREHGVTGLVPFMQQAWGDARIVPIIVRLDVSHEAREQLASVLAERLRDDSNALLVMSVDFSHDLPAAVADFHDILAQDVVQSLADRETDRVELDSPGALAVGLKVARTLELGDVTIHSHTNSLTLAQAVIAQDSTSHFVASFSPGLIQPQAAQTLFFVGDIMLDREVRNRIAANPDPLFPFHQIRDNENRFFRGMDAVVANLEGPVTASRKPPEKTIDFAFDPSVTTLLRDIGITAVSQANNHQLDQGREGADDSRRFLTDAGIAAFGDQVRDDRASSLWMLDQRGQRVAVLGFNTTDNPLDRAAASSTLAELRRETNRIVVFMHWGSEYQAKPSSAQTELAHWFIDHGATAVIGAHPHWTQSVEVYRNRLIAYSLGNFVFDQDWSAETRSGLVAGLAFLPDRTELHLFPIQIDKSVPRLLTGDERQARLDHLAEISDPSLAEMIKGGMIMATY